MKKDELVKSLMAAAEIEEGHSPFVAKFCAENFDWAGLDEESVKRVRRLLETIKNQTINHERMLNELLGQIRDSGANEF